MSSDLQSAASLHQTCRILLEIMLYSSRTSYLKISCLLFNFLLSPTGCPVGNILAIPITGMLAKYGFDGGWPSVFYCFGKQIQLQKSALLTCRGE